MNDKNKVGKSILYNSIGSGIYLFCQWIITFIVVWISGYETAGILSISMSVSTTFCVIATFNMRNFQSSDLKGKYSEKTYLITRAFTTIISIIVTLIYSLIKDFSMLQFLCINLYMIFKVSEAVVDVLHGSLQKKWRFDIIGLSYIFRGLISLALFSITLFLTNNLVLAIASMSIGVYIFIYFFDIRKYKENIKDYGKFKKIYSLQLIIQCIPLSLYGLVFSYVAMYPRVYAEQLYGAELIGYYASVATVALVVQTAASFIFNPLISLFANYFNNKDFKKFNKEMFKIIFFILLIGLVALIGSHFLADWGLGLLFGKGILPYTYLFSGVLIVSILTAIIWFLGMLLVVIRRNVVLLIGAIAAFVVSYILTPVLLEKYQLNGINITLIIAYVFQMLTYLVFLIFNKKTKLSKKKTIYYIRSTSVINDSRASKEITSLIKNGYEVHVIGWDRNRKIENYKDFKINGKSIKCSFLKFRADFGESIKSLVGLCLFQFWIFWILLKDNKKYQCIHACDFDCGFTSLIISQLFDKKLIYDIYDYYSDSREMSLKLEKIISKIENKVINNADVTIICGEWRKKQIAIAKPRKVIVIHNSPDILNIGKENIIKGNSRKIKIVYVGILQEHRLLLEILEEIKKHNEYELHIGGFGKYEKEFKNAADSYDNIYYYGSLKYNQVLALEEKCDILFATYDPKIKNHKYSAPNKVYEAMALGKPIIVCKGTGIDELVTKNKIGIAVDYDSKSFIIGLEIICSDKRKIKQISSVSKKLFNNKYTWSIMELELIKMYETVFNEIDSKEEYNDYDNNTNI